jgi:hypothetical protein
MSHDDRREPNDDEAAHAFVKLRAYAAKRSLKALEGSIEANRCPLVLEALRDLHDWINEIGHFAVIRG